MIREVFIRERVSIKLKIVATVVVIVYLFVAFLVSSFSMISAGLFFLIGVFFVGVSKVHCITSEFRNETLFSCFGLVLYRKKLVLEFPDYIAVFHASFVMRDEVEGDEDKYKKWVLRFFKENRYVTLLEDDEYNYILEKANQLGELLDIPVHDRSK